MRKIAIHQITNGDRSNQNSYWKRQPRESGSLQMDAVSGHVIVLAKIYWPLAALHLFASHLESHNRFNYHNLVPENLCNQACVSLCNVLYLFLIVWVKSSSPSSYALRLAIIFTTSRHESATPMLKGRMFSYTEFWVLTLNTSRVYRLRGFSSVISSIMCAHDRVTASLTKRHTV